jgi:hypothetical protein
MRLHKEEEQICRELGNPEGLAISLSNQASVVAVKRERLREALSLAEEAYRLATEHGLIALTRKIEPLLNLLRSRIEQAPPAPVYVPTPHPGANAEAAAELNIRYQQDLASWNALSWWQRLKVKKPEPPRGI